MLSDVDAVEKLRKAIGPVDPEQGPVSITIACETCGHKRESPSPETIQFIIVENIIHLNRLPIEKDFCFISAFSTCLNF